MKYYVKVTFFSPGGEKELLSQMQGRLKYPVARGSDSVKTGLEIVCCRDLFLLLNSEV